MAARRSMPGGNTRVLAGRGSPDAAARRALVRAVQWVAGNLDRFNTPAADVGSYPGIEYQRVCELGTALLLLSRLESCPGYSGVVPRKAVDAIRSFLTALQRRPDYADQILRKPIGFVLFCSMYGALRSLGDDDPAIRARLERALDAGYLECMEREPHRLMDVKLALEWAALEHPWPEWSDITADALVAQPFSALALSESAAYALTHDIMFLTAFATRPFRAGGLDTEGLRRTLVTMLVSTCRDRHWDLLGEFLICWHAVGFSPAPVSERAWQAFLDVQRSDGSFPGPERKRSSADPQPDDADTTFKRSYHTTLVAILALYARAACTPVVTERPPRRRVHTASAQADVSRALAGAVSWLDTLSTARGGELDCTVGGRLLAAYWICEGNGIPSSIGFRGIAERVRDGLARPGAASDARPAPAALRIVTCALLRRAGLAVPELDAFVGHAARALGNAPPRDAASDLGLCEARVLLHALGRHRRPALVGRGALLRVLRTAPLTMSGAGLEEMLMRVESFAGYGTRKPAEPIPVALQELLASVAAHAFRTYDLEQGCRALRALLYVGGHGERVEPLTAFLLQHQRPHGAFGFMGPEYALLASQGFSPELDLELPTTLSAIWTLAEAANPGWRLFASLGAGSDVDRSDRRGYTRRPRSALATASDFECTWSFS